MVPASGAMQRQQHSHVVIRVKDVVQRGLRDMANLTTGLEATGWMGGGQTYSAVAAGCQRTPCPRNDIMDSVVRVPAP
jgi:hypothetical protein